MQERDGSQASCSHLRARSREREIFSVELFIVKTIFEISKYFFNISMSESENEGGSNYFGQFLDFQFTTELAP